MEDRLFTLGEFSKYLKISKSTIYKLAEWGQMPCCKVGKQLRFRRSSIDKWLSEKEAAYSAKMALRNSDRILVVDDDALVLNSIARFLKIHGFAVETAESGEDALEKVKRMKFNLVIADVRMPGIDGIETVRRIREYNHSHNRPDVPEIVITGFADPESQRKAEELGIVDYIYKPFATADFIKTIKEKLEFAPSEN